MLNVVSSLSGAVSDSRRPATGRSGEVGGCEGGVQNHQETSQVAGDRAAAGPGGAEECVLVT